ncbi:T9SS type A sorting domain-containing protein [Parafilimonas terrae]|uniref:Delta-60 repeat domain-containing protein/Por secretion system C-terminal sorting domain-containing protein n=1 Tax=Parafilimonas terrae TaxID=1465490 RepID=A0A1I5ZFY0_9BACT|nr:T9SS type A sorting domain-containing protein [Parafilimonas terrae]SFQ55366.1 delta-60 repeat domain-containing protein/Por secretion system C-terminal sorting domain-containing protein [Parafilimonas terrae]
MKTIFTFFVCCLTALTLFAQPGTLDRSFGDTGVVITPIYGELLTIGLQSDGKIIAAGASTSLDKDGSTLARYLNDGTIDSSFGENGISTLNNQAAVYSLAILDDDNIIVLATNNNIVLAKYLSDGKLDSTFGVNGQTIKAFPGKEIFMRAVKVQQDGKIVATGGAFLSSESEYKIFTARFNTNGSPDESFGNDGYTMLDGFVANSLLIQPDGKIVVGGDTGLDDMFITARYLPDGSLDESFGNNGVVTTKISNHRSYINALALQPDDKIIAVGSKDYGEGGMLAVRYMPDGSLDESFGDAGFTNLNFNNGSEAYSTLLQPDGKIILSGACNNFSDFAMARLKTNGIIDSSFGENGLLITDAGGEAISNSASLQKDGKIILGGSDYSTNFILARYNNNIQNNSPIARLKKWIKHHILHWQDLQSGNVAYYTIERSNNKAGGFHQIAKINKQATETYSYALPSTLNNSLQTMNYYRINAVDNSGNITASALLSDAETEEAATVSIYPNPVKNMLYIKGLDASASYSLQVSNRQGNIVAKATIKQASLYKLNVERLPKGVYYLKLVSGINITDLKFVKE